MERPNLDLLKKELEKLYGDFQTDLPSGNTPQEIAELRKQASHASSSMFTLSLYRRVLDEYIRKKESEVILQHNIAKDVPTPKQENLRAFVNQELATEKSYYNQLDTMIDIAKTRTLLIMSLLKSLGEERYV